MQLFTCLLNWIFGNIFQLNCFYLLPYCFQSVNDFISVDRAIINPYFGQGKPDYDKIQARRNNQEQNTIPSPPDK